MNQDEDSVKYLGDSYYRVKLKIASRLMASMMANSKVYTWSSCGANQETQKQLEEDLVVIAHDMAVKLIHYCSPAPEEDEVSTLP